MGDHVTSNAHGVTRDLPNGEKNRMSDHERGAVDADVWTRAGVEAGGTLPEFAWPGGYPIVYFDHDTSIVCAECANKRDWSEARIIACDVFWEGAPETCANCNKAIESAYGDPDAGGGTMAPL